jgi:hypothetical protein
MTDWKALAASRGLSLTEAELSKLAAVLDALEPAAQALAANLTHDVQPATTCGEEAVEAR